MSIRTCRLCLNEDSFSLDLFGDESRCRDVLYKIKFCIPIVKISKNDSYPKHICFKCLSTLEIMSDFLKKCVASESILTRSSQFPPDEVMNYSAYSSHSHTGKYRRSNARRSASSSSSRGSTPDWAKVTKAKSPCFQKQPDRAPMQESDAKKRKASPSKDTFNSAPSRATPGSFIHPPTFGGGVEVGKKPVIQHRANTVTATDIFSRLSQGDKDEDENGKFLTNFWKDPPVKPQANSMTQPDKDCSLQIPRSSGSDISASKKDTKATVGPPHKASQILGHIMDNWNPAGEKTSCGLDRSQIMDCVNN